MNDNELRQFWDDVSESLTNARRALEQAAQALRKSEQAGHRFDQVEQLLGAHSRGIRGLECLFEVQRRYHG